MKCVLEGFSIAGPCATALSAVCNWLIAGSYT